MRKSKQVEVTESEARWLLEVDEKSEVAAYLLWTLSFVGICGLQRFYVGKWKSGLLWLFTFGLLGFGQIFDLFRTHYWFDRAAVVAAYVEGRETERALVGAAGERMLAARDERTALTGAEQITEPEDETVRLPGFDRPVTFRSSRSGRYGAVWAGGEWSEEPPSPGIVALTREDELVWRKELPNPEEATASDDGYLCVLDRQVGQRLSGTFYLFDRQGEEIVRRNVAEGIGTFGFSEDDSLAWFSTEEVASEDENGLWIFETETGEQLLHTSAPSGPVQVVERTSWGYLIEGPDGMALRLDTDGKMLNAEEVRRQSADRMLRSPHLPSILYGVREVLDIEGEVGRAEADWLLARLEAAEGVADSLEQRALVERRRGEVFEAAGRTREALSSFYRARSLDESVGVRRLIERLEDELAGRPRS